MHILWEIPRCKNCGIVDPLIFYKRNACARADDFGNLLKDLMRLNGTLKEWIEIIKFYSDFFVFKLILVH